MTHTIKLLFLCSRNPWRSTTAEALFKNHPRYSARSASTENGARIKVTACHIGWADLIFCMEQKHADHLHQFFTDEMSGKPVIILRISDDCPTGHDPERAEHLHTALAPHLPDLRPTSPENLPTRTRLAT